MSPGQWVLVILGFVLVCWVAGSFIEIANHQTDGARAKTDMEAMLLSGGKKTVVKPLHKPMNPHNYDH